MKKIIAFAKYLAFEAGGAEASMRQILKSLSLKGHPIHVVFVEAASFGRNYKFDVWKIPSHYTQSSISTAIQLFKFSFTDAALNALKIFFYFSKLDPGSILHSYGLWGVAAGVAYKGECVFYLRAISDIGVIENHHRGALRFLKAIYILLELPGVVFYRVLLRRLSHKATIVANSRFMAEEFYKRFGSYPIIQYPDVNEKGLLERWPIKKLECSLSEKGILFIGDSNIKGLYIVDELIKRRTLKAKIYVVGRFENRPVDTDVVSYLPWSSDPLDIYKYAKLIIVPSICSEAFGRVAYEGRILSIPMLVSNVGGLPEAAANEQCIISDYRNIDEWELRINRLIDKIDTKEK